MSTTSTRMRISPLTQCGERLLRQHLLAAPAVGRQEPRELAVIGWTPMMFLSVRKLRRFEEHQPYQGSELRREGP